MTLAKAFAAPKANTPLAPWSFDRREPRANDVEMEVLFCGVCHSDVHQARDEWGPQHIPHGPGP